MFFTPSLFERVGGADRCRRQLGRHQRDNVLFITDGCWEAFDFGQVVVPCTFYSARNQNATHRRHAFDELQFDRRGGTA